MGDHFAKRGLQPMNLIVQDLCFLQHVSTDPYGFTYLAVNYPSSSLSDFPLFQLTRTQLEALRPQEIFSVEREARAVRILVPTVPENLN